MKINRLEEVFREKKIQNRVLASYLNKSEETISKWKNNKRQPSLENLNEIAKFIHVDIRELLEPSSFKEQHSETYEEYKRKLK